MKSTNRESMELFNGAQKSKERGGEPLWTLIYQTLSGQSWLLWLLTSTRNLFLFFVFFYPASKPWSCFLCFYTRRTWSSAVRRVYLYCSRKLYFMHKVKRYKEEGRWLYCFSPTFLNPPRLPSWRHIVTGKSFGRLCKLARDTIVIRTSENEDKLRS